MAIPKPHRNLFYSRHLFFTVLLFYVVACAEVPITHRKSLHLVPESELLTMSLQQYDEVLKKKQTLNGSTEGANGSQGGV